MQEHGFCRPVRIPSKSLLCCLLQVSWSPDSTQLISASGDKTVKLWDVGAGTAVTTFKLGTDVSDQQLGCLWQGQHLLSISLSGYINYLDKNNPDRPIRTIKVRIPAVPQCICCVLKCYLVTLFLNNWLM